MLVICIFRGEEVIYVYIHNDTSSNLMNAMDIECGGFTFISNFDSGNLARVELVSKKQNVNHSPGKNSPAEEVPDFEFNIWTKPDCAGTEFENSNRTWFYFGIKGGTPFVLVKLNIVNLNRQSKMYSQGMAPVFRMVPGRSNWDRVKEKPTYAVEDDVFILSFKYRTLENIRATTYFAFTYPFTYVDLQNMLNSIDTRFRNPPGEFRIPNCLDDIYYHRECVCYSLEGRHVDLITISSFHNMSSERETRLKNLFPMSDVPRPFCFHRKKVVFVSARVHPGETPSSFVLNGLLNLLLTRDDPVAILLRKIYVFKLIPMLNPDGVSQGHYRTDTRGVNLNRMYLNPVFELHPSVYAARALIRYYHHGQEMEEEFAVDSVIPNTDCKSVNKHLLSASELEKLKHDGAATISSLKCLSPERQDDVRNNREHLLQLSDTGRISGIENQVSGLSLDEKQNESSQCSATSTNNRSEPAPQNSNISMMVQEKRDLFSTIHANILNAVGNADAICNHNNNNNNNTIPVLSEGLPGKPLLLRSISSIVEVSAVPLYTCKVDERITDSSVLNSVVSVDGCLSDTLPSVCEKVSSADHSIGSSSGKAIADTNAEEDYKCLKYEGEMNVSSQNFDPHHNKSPEGLPNKVDSKKITITPEDSGLYLYVDLHGHASKKGIFMYGNYFEDTEDSIECMLLPKIMSLNSQNFHFTACNFTEKIMYLRDRRDGMSREGSGRVAVWKTTGLVRSYTLECNYNTGRLVNILPPCMKEIKNSPAVALLVPPKYTPQVFEEVGRALGVSILDLTGLNPWSRIPNSEFHTLLGIRDWLRINCLPEQNYVHKVMQDQKLVKRQPCNAQVGGMAGMSNGVPPHLMHPSSSKSRLTSNRRDTNFARTRRLAPLVTKSSESKVDLCAH
ncbi:cytosolic carboxypeptidase-like protein 5 isoform X1 [Cryptotermes secundus]|uniref:cytosolic carboxypeptidase-like protein 5 isoform X1 n=1 Tax=Cryptotermes secundus TaxID=105785 RepID=UPI000CD7ADE8|nr:cytosolic carboxypeptidase-like protein 5 isoform X1 [Cryptotermes secundus]